MNEEPTGTPAQAPAQTHEQMEKLLSDIKIVLKDGQDLLRTGFGTVRERALSGMHCTEELVREKPYQSLGVIFGLGVLVGVLAVGMMSRDSDKD